MRTTANLYADLHLSRWGIPPADKSEPACRMHVITVRLSLTKSKLELFLHWALAALTHPPKNRLALLNLGPAWSLLQREAKTVGIDEAIRVARVSADVDKQERTMHHEEAR